MSTPMPARPSNRLVRPSAGRKLGGVAAGIADRYGWSRNSVRILLVASIILPGPQVLAYIAAWLLIPDESKPVPPPAPA